ncbi:MAG: monofunctional biosynthetic peptidoglycan transglycosylase [Elusimicrobiota bacterium]
MRLRRRIQKSGLIILAAAGSCAALAAAYVFWLPDVRPLKKSPPKTTAYIELRRREAAAKGRRFDLRWTWVPADEISDNLKKAVVTAEDDTFYRHDGVDLDALRAAWKRDKKEGKLKMGGSTIDMQLARNLYLSPAKNPLRKLKEMLIARRLDRELGKRRVLELYLNVVEWGRGVFGCEAAARAYFDKSCAELTPDEAVAMAVVLPNPRRWDPAKRGPYVERNSARIVARMAASGLWPDDEDDVESSTAAAAAPVPDVSASTEPVAR